MNKFFKYFPVAMAMATLASCSSDDLVGVSENVPGYELSENDILVMMDEGLMTRAAFGEMQVYTDAAKTKTGILRSIFFTPGDEIKLYDDDNWRPQTYVYNEDATKKLYHFKPGDEVNNNESRFASVFTPSENNPKGTKENTYKAGYGVYPANLSTFDGELREKINFDMSGIAFIDGNALKADTSDFVTSYEPSKVNKVRRTAMPMWGNLGETVVSGKVNPKAGALRLMYLTGFLRVGITGTEAQKGQDAWLVIRSTDKQLTGKYVAQDFDYTAKEAPALEGQEAASVRKATVLNKYVYATADANKANKGGKDQNGNTVSKADLDNTTNGSGIIVMKLPQMEKDFNEAIYVPIPVGKYQLSVQLVMQGTAATNSVEVLDLSTAEPLLDEDEFEEIEKNGDTYYLDLYNDANVELNTPFDLANFIKMYDGIGRNITVTVDHTIYVKGNTTPQDQNLYIGNLDHDVTVNLKGGIKVATTAEDAKDHNPSLYITKSGKGKLTLNLGENEDVKATDYPVIVVREDGTDDGNYKVIKSSNVTGDEGGIVINGIDHDFTLPKLVVETKKDVVTLKTGAEVVSLKGKMIIDALDKTIKQLNMKEDGSVLTLNNGTITTVVTDGVAANPANPVVIESKGKSFIKNVVAVTTGTVENTDKWEEYVPDGDEPKEWAGGTTNNYTDITLKSEWDGVYYVNDTEESGEKTKFEQQADIHTAAQFSMGGYEENSKLRTNLKIGKTFKGQATDAQKQWKGLALTTDFDGTGKTVELVTEYKGGNQVGLFSVISNTAAMTVKDIKLTADVQPEFVESQTANRNQIGGLAGAVTADATNALTFSKIVLGEDSKVGYFTEYQGYGLNSAGTMNWSASKIGGLVGAATGKVTFLDCTAKGQVGGFAALGGYVGHITGANTIVTFGSATSRDGYNVCTTNVTFKESRTITNNYNSYYGTVGNFVGMIGNGGTASDKARVHVHYGSYSSSNLTDNIKSATNLYFDRNHIDTGKKDDFGNSIYYNYKGSSYNLIGYSKEAKTESGADANVVRYDWVGSRPDYEAIPLKQNLENTLENNFYNWFGPQD